MLSSWALKGAATLSMMTLSKMTLTQNDIQHKGKHLNFLSQMAF